MKFRHLVSFTHICYLTVVYDVFWMSSVHFSRKKGAMTLCDTVVRMTALRYDITVAVSFVSFKIKFQNVV